MTTINTSSQPPQLHYDFAQPDLWQERIGSIDDTLDATFKLLQSSVTTLSGVSVPTFLRLVHQAGGANLTHLLDSARQSGAEGADSRLLQALEAQALSDSLSLFLVDLLKSLLRTGKLSLAAPESSRSWDEDFELKQMLSLYMLGIGLNSFFWGPLNRLMQASLEQHRGAQTPPPLHLIRRCFRLTGVDAEMLQRAVVQRRWEVDTSGTPVRSLQATSLLVTDKLTAKALAPMQQRLPGAQAVKPLTYFSRETHIHRLPYSDNFVLVGLSYDLITPTASRRTYGAASDGAEKKLPAFELMAIPHEVGHFVYHQAGLKDGLTCEGLCAEFADNPYGHWCEEIFADVYGCLVAGPLTALGLQAILATGNREKVEMDDGEHPTPVVRPFVLSEILRELGRQLPDRYAFVQATKSLDANWTGILKNWGFEIVAEAEGRPTRIKLPGPADDYRETVINVQTVVAALRPVIRKLVHSLLESADFSPWPNSSPNALSADIPWSREDYADLTRYDGDMARLTGNEVAYKSVTDYQISGAGSQWLRAEGETADQQLQNFVARWNDSGPTGHGDHP